MKGLSITCDIWCDEAEGLKTDVLQWTKDSLPSSRSYFWFSSLRPYFNWVQLICKSHSPHLLLVRQQIKPMLHNWTWTTLVFIIWTKKKKIYIYKNIFFPLDLTIPLKVQIWAPPGGFWVITTLTWISWVCCFVWLLNVRLKWQSWQEHPMDLY